MLILARKEQQRLLVLAGGQQIWITFLGTAGGRQGRIGIEAPAGVAVVREEILGEGKSDAEKRDQRAVA